MKSKEKPLILVIEDVKKDIINYINKISNENCLSYYFLEIILKDLYHEVLEKTEIEKNNLYRQYVEKIEEQKGDDN